MVSQIRYTLSRFSLIFDFVKCLLKGILMMVITSIWGGCYNTFPVIIVIKEIFLYGTGRMGETFS